MTIKSVSRAAFNNGSINYTDIVMTKRMKTISIPIDFDTDDGYSVLKSKRMVHFLLDSIRQGNNL